MRVVLFLAVWMTAATCLAQTSIDAEEVISIGGIRQFITIKSHDRSLPLFLFLHGGPGGSVMNHADRFTDRLQQHFVVIQWDQRQTGRTRQLNDSPVSLSLTIFQNDTRALIDSLLKRFHRQKLYLAGHSWGTALGFHIARTSPELLYAYLPIGPMIHQVESERIALNLMKQKALAQGYHKQFQELSLVQVPFENGTQLFYHRKHLLDFSGSRGKLARTYVEDWAATWLEVFNEASKESLLETLPSIACPVYFFLGRKDFQTNSTLAERYYTTLTAPKKNLFWFEYSGHGVPTSEPDLLQSLIIEKVLPETFIIQKPDGVIGLE